MKTLLAAVLSACLLSAGVQAAPVTIDFEEFSIGDGDASFPNIPNPIFSQGYEISGQDAPFSSAEVIVGANTGGTQAYGGSTGGAGTDGFGPTVFIELTRTDGQAFGISGLDLFLDSDSMGRTEIRGIDAASGLPVFLTNVAVGTGGWGNLSSITFRAEGNGFGFGFATAEVDNIVANVVPIPAAVWLFGSALAGLGWLRRKPVARG